MKLRNKKTGYMATADRVWVDDTNEQIVVDVDGELHRYYTLDALREEWEDYEEPKEYWYIYADGDIYKDVQDDVRKDNGCKEIGNYFETKEEAEKAVEKLKAWKRLKDKGFERVFSLGLVDALCGGKAVAFELLIDDKASIEDIKLLFGGEE